mmetsp:Transcript_7409/g.18951  ORF Transcript_7409/g.18951 Transcript_7409/m.18951 type:complete len:177 (-) Transcript_7409:274-804(-)
MPLEVPADYGYVIAATGVIGITQLFIGGRVMGVRSKCFKSEAFLKAPETQAMNDEHKKVFGSEINSMGYPDMGNGRYSAQLSYPLWVQFNNAQRAHHNMLESSGPVLASMVAAGLVAPKAAAALGVGYAAGRWVYALGYTSDKGADGRTKGAMVGALCMLGLYGMALVTGVRSALM